MDMQAFESRGSDRRVAPACAPICLETLEVVEQAFLQLLRSLRREAGAAQARAEGEAEYASWQSVRVR